MTIVFDMLGRGPVTMERTIRSKVSSLVAFEPDPLFSAVPWHSAGPFAQPTVRDGPRRMQMAFAPGPFGMLGSIGHVIPSAAMGSFGGVGAWGSGIPGPGGFPNPPVGGGHFYNPVELGCSGLSSSGIASFGGWHGFGGVPDGSFIDLIPDPARGGADAFAFWLVWGASNNDCLWWILSNGHLPSTDAYVPPDVFSLSDLHRRMKACHPPPLRGDSSCLFPDELRDPASMGLSFSFESEGAPSCTNVTHDVWESALGAAWQVLRQNDDIVRWLGCILDPDLGACLKRVLGGFVTAHFNMKDPSLDDPPEVYGMQHVGGKSSDGHVYVNIDSPSSCWQKELMINSIATGAAAKGRDCALADLAAVLLHELVHHCASRSGVRYDVHGAGEDAHGDCSLAWMIASAFRWSMSKRYPWITESTECAGWGAAGVLFAD